MDGWITIGTDIDSKKFEKELNKLEKKSETFAKEEEKLLAQKAKLEIKVAADTKEYEKKIKSLSQEYNAEIELATPITGEPINPNKKMEIDAKYQQELDQINAKYQTQKSSLNQINQKIKENAANQEEVKNKIEETKAKMDGLNLNFDNIGKSMTNNVKKIAKWAAAVFSLRSAYSAIRQATSFISQYNDSINNKLYSMKMFFATALEPIVTRLVDLFWKILTYVNYIVKAWFGVDLFAKASANSLKSGAKSAKEIKKSLAGFDEANILNDNGTTGASESSSPKFEMPENIEIPSWIKWIADNKDIVLGFLKQLAILIGTLKLAKLLLQIGGIGKGLSKIFTFLKGMSKLQIFALLAGVVVTLTGIVTTVKGIIAFIKDPSWENFITILEGIALTIGGVTVAMIALNSASPISWIQKAIVVGSALTIMFIELGKTLFKDKANILSVKDAQEELKKAQDNLKQSTEELTSATKSYDDALKNAEEASKLLAEAEKKNKISGEELFSQVLDGKLKYQDMTIAQKEVYNAYTNNLDAQNKLKTSTEELENSVNNYKEAKKKETEASWENQLAIAKESSNYDEFRDSVVKACKDGSLGAEEARTLIERAMAGMDEATAKTFIENIPSDIKEGLNPNRYKSEAENLKNFFGRVWDDIKDSATKTWNTITRWFDKGIKVPISVEASGGTLRSAVGHAKGAIVYPKLQYHANGGIINQPGRGVPITQHIGGERGAEGIVPLTDSQQMDLLGQAIARHMTINLTNVTQMNGRVLSRELKIMEAQQDFATNR